MSLPGVAFASATSSFTVVAFTFEFATSTTGTAPSCVTWAKSRATAYGVFGNSTGLMDMVLLLVISSL
nr:hypothetical protein [Delftia sp.]